MLMTMGLNAFPACKCRPKVVSDYRSDSDFAIGMLRCWSVFNAPDTKPVTPYNGADLFWVIDVQRRILIIQTAVHSEIPGP